MFLSLGSNRSLGPYLAFTGPTAYAPPGRFDWAGLCSLGETFYDSSKPSKQQFGT
jgi:hypothetical protein